MALDPFIDPRIADCTGSGRDKDPIHHLPVCSARFWHAEDPLCCG